MIEITSKRDGFRRCGVAHSREATRWPDHRFTADQLAILQAEPMLIVTVTPDPPVIPAQADPGEKAGQEIESASGTEGTAPVAEAPAAAKGKGKGKK